MAESLAVLMPRHRRDYELSGSYVPPSAGHKNNKNFSKNAKSRLDIPAFNQVGGLNRNPRAAMLSPSRRSLFDPESIAGLISL